MGSIGHRSANDEGETASGEFHTGNLPDIGYVFRNGDIGACRLAELISAHAEDLGLFVLA